MSIDCLKITEDKLLDNIVHTSDVNIIKAIDVEFKVRVSNITAVPRRRARGPHLNIIAVPKRKARRLRFNTTAALKREARGPRSASPQWLNANLKPAFQLQMSPASKL